LALPNKIRGWSLRTLKEKLIKIGAKIVKHARYIIFQMAEVAVPRALFQEILDRIRRLTLVALSPGVG
jgi:hypothetical protein